MNTLLHFADAALQYHRGKQTGLWGLIGIGLGILAVVFWDNFLPFFEFIGLVDFFKGLGIVHENASYMTAFKVFMFFFMASILLMLLGWVLLGIFGVVMGMAQNNFVIKLFFLLIGIILSPIIIVVFLYLAIFGKASREQRKLEREDPEAFKEMERLKKNKMEIDYLKYGEDGNKDYTISYEEAYNRLNRLPTDGDNLFLLGVTYDREVFLLLPCALTIHDNGYGKNIGDVFAVKLDLELEHYYQRVNKKPKLIVIDFIIRNIGNPNRDRYFSSKRIPLPLKDFEEIIDPLDNKKMQEFINKYSKTKDFISYVKTEQNFYFGNKKKLLDDLVQCNSEEEYKAKYEELQLYNVPNEDIVRLIWETQNKAEEEEKTFYESE